MIAGADDVHLLHEVVQQAAMVMSVLALWAAGMRLKPVPGYLPARSAGLILEHDPGRCSGFHRLARSVSALLCMYRTPLVREVHL
jgi:hypothetical protein